ncbi:MAG TPA: hypothetical protein VG097_08225 [Gemmata sp.]|jgi:hypothetical protein|nr:hypothetical protein [Gemmata sp.]
MSTAAAVATRNQACCYFSTPEHVRSFVGRFLWIYTGKGSLNLTPETLICEVSNLVCEIPLRSIRGIEVGHYSRWAKPIKLNYIELTYMSQLLEKTVLFTPTHSWATPVWKTNALVESWTEWLEEAVERAG